MKNETKQPSLLTYLIALAPIPVVREIALELGLRYEAAQKPLDKTERALAHISTAIVSYAVIPAYFYYAKPSLSLIYHELEKLWT